MKCSNCGCEEFFEKPLMTGSGCTEGGAWQPIEINGRPVIGYICKKCGHIEFFSPKALEAFKKSEAKEAKERYLLKEKSEKIASLKSEFEEARKIANDENQTVKASNDAKARMAEIKKELEALGDHSLGNVPHTGPNPLS